MRVALLVLLCACSPRIGNRAPADAEQQLNRGMWCVSGVLEDRRFVGCADSLRMCRRAEEAIRQRGRLVGVRSVSPCVPVGGD